MTRRGEAQSSSHALPCTRTDFLLSPASGNRSLERFAVSFRHTIGQLRSV